MREHGSESFQRENAWIFDTPGSVYQRKGKILLKAGLKLRVTMSGREACCPTVTGGLSVIRYCLWAPMPLVPKPRDEQDSCACPCFGVSTLGSSSEGTWPEERPPAVAGAGAEAGRGCETSGEPAQGTGR